MVAHLLGEVSHHRLAGPSWCYHWIARLTSSNRSQRLLGSNDPKCVGTILCDRRKAGRAPLVAPDFGGGVDWRCRYNLLACDVRHAGFNVERMPHGLFRKLSLDRRLLGAFTCTFLLAIAITALSFISRNSWPWLAIAIMGAGWGTALILGLFLYAYRTRPLSY